MAGEFAEQARDLPCQTEPFAGRGKRPRGPAKRLCAQESDFREQASDLASQTKRIGVCGREFAGELCSRGR